MNFLDLTSLSYFDVFIRMALAVFFGLCLGIDRDMKNKPVDFRAYVITCASTCLLAIMGQELFIYYKDAAEGNFISLDMGKIISGALTGIGFLGAGAIIKNSNDNIVGTATGASIWASSIIGLCLGFGFIFLASIGFAVILSALLALGFIRDCVKTK
jgi:putative Mg2+ transporter-C (MgtC) family protein